LNRVNAPDEQHIRSMFDGLVERYDLVNDVLSLGLDRWWRRMASAALEAAPGERVLDLGCGTGRLGALLAARLRVVGLDLSGAMLAKARQRPIGWLGLVQGSAFRLPFREASFDAAASAFVLRNLNDLPRAFAEVARVVTPGGRVAFLDLTEPSLPSVGRLFDMYFRRAAPALGALVGRREEYRYLVRSLGHLPPSGELCEMLNRSGFVSCMAKPLTGGVVTLFTATRRIPLSDDNQGRPNGAPIDRRSR
jgi:demethylmenaquinone methyltransferase / 2-methoxy-6-polyprenyl-1,4-benzoquinol methylase